MNFGIQKSIEVLEGIGEMGPCWETTSRQTHAAGPPRSATTCTWSGGFRKHGGGGGRGDVAPPNSLLEKSSLIVVSSACFSLVSLPMLLCTEGPSSIVWLQRLLKKAVYSSVMAPTTTDDQIRQP